ncbi:MAG: tetratricopeptide repeat protein, partial [Candidatus Eisenbacteria sp.]|nr:tetratricopeptide repeat protein [Candidatus Eisenbacteria bacterium]
GGINFWIGNHPNALGTFDLPPGIRGTPEQVNLIDSTRLATGAVGHALKPSEVSSFWFGKGLEYMRDNPGEYAALLLRKIRMFWNRFEIPLNVNFHFLRHYSPFLRVPLMHFGAVSPLAILGIALSLPLWKRMLPAYAFVAVYFLSAAVFFVSARYRLPAVPVLIPFACYATWWFYRKIRHRKWKPVSIAAAVLVVLTVHANAPVAGMSEQRSFGRDYYYLACQHRSKGHITEAIANYRESLAHNPDFWMAHNGLGICLSEIDRMEEAVESFERAMALAPTRSEPWFNMGTALATHGRVPEAVRKWERALELDPYDKAARSNLERARKLMQAGPQGE